MKVLLKEDVENLGLAGEVHTVADGYGRNYLIPRGLVVKADQGAMKQAQAWSARAAARREELRAEYEQLSARIRETKLTFVAKAGDKGKLYGSVTMADVADQMNAALGTDIDRRKVEGEALRQLGDHTIVVRLNADFQPELAVRIVAEGAELEESVEETAEEAVEEAVEEIVEEAETEEAVESVEAEVEAETEAEPV
jgi:large subunit ribosomal protein L9